LWDLEADQPLGFPLTLHAKSVRRLAFIDDDNTVLSADADGLVATWDLNLASWRRQACRIANRNMTYGEWAQYIGEEPYRLTCPAFRLDPTLVEAGRDVAAKGNVDGATAILQRAMELGDETVREPRTEAVTIAVKGFVDRGNRLAKAGNVSAAEALFTSAVDLKPELQLEPSIEARRLAAPFLVEQGSRLARMGRVTEALEAYEKAKTYDGDLDIRAQSWLDVCSAGVFGGAAKDVLKACESTVESMGGSGKFRDHLGIARALTGDTEGAIREFEDFVAFERDPRNRAGRTGSVQERRQLDYIDRVLGWIDALKAKQDPFTKAELEEASSYRKQWLSR
jgi:tetratricopeptide (TPR) repeat protein